MSKTIKNEKNEIQRSEVFRKIYSKFRKEPSWLLKRILLEFRSPVLPSTKFIFSNFNKLRILYQKLVRHLLSHADDHGDDVLSVFYDLNCNPITFDFAYFLVGAEVFAKQNGKSKLFIWFVQKNKDSIKDEEYLKHVDEGSQDWRINNVLLPLARMHTAYAGYGILPQGTSVNKYIKRDLIYPEGFCENYSPRFNYKDLKDSIGLSTYRGFQISLQGQKYINSWKNYSKIRSPIVSITLRNYGFDPSRNSNIKEWAKFADWVSQRGYTPVFIPDVDTCWEPDNGLGAYLVFTEACWNLEIRMAFYNSCFVSFFYSNGLAACAILNKNIRCISMHPIISDSLVANEKAYTTNVMTIGDRTANFGESFQWSSWKRDSFENIKSEFLEFENQFSDQLSQEKNAD